MKDSNLRLRGEMKTRYWDNKGDIMAPLSYIKSSEYIPGMEHWAFGVHGAGLLSDAVINTDL